MSEQEMRRKVFWLIAIRLAIGTLLLGSAVLIQFNVPSMRPAVSHFYYLIGLIYALSIVWAASLTFAFRRRWLIDLQLAGGALGPPQSSAVSGLLPSWWTDTSVPLPPLNLAQYTVAINVFGFFAVAVLSGSLAESLRRAGARLERAASGIADLQALNQHVIDSLVSGLATTDLLGQILTFNRAATTITGLSASNVIGRRTGEAMGFPPDL